MREQTLPQQITHSIQPSTVVIRNDVNANTPNVPNPTNDSIEIQSPQPETGQNPLEINIVKHINITGLSNTPFRLNTRTSLVAENNQWLVSSTIPVAPSPDQTPSTDLKSRPAHLVYSSQFTSNQATTPIESVEFFPKPVKQERRARQKQLISQPVYESLPNSYERVHCLAGDPKTTTTTTRTQIPNILEDQALSSQTLKQSVQEAYLSEHMLNRDRDVISSPNNNPLPKMFLQMLLTGAIGTVPQPLNDPLDASTLNQYLTNYMNDLGQNSRFDPNSMFPTPQLPQYRQHEPMDQRAGKPVSVSSTSKQCILSPFVVQHHDAHQAQNVPQVASFAVAVAIGQSSREMESVPNFTTDSFGTKQEVSLTQPNPHVTALKTSAIDFIIPNMHGNPMVAARSVDHVISHVKAVEQTQPTSVSQHTIQPNRNDPNYAGPWQNPAPNIPTLPKTDLADIRTIPLEQLYSSIMSEPQLIDPGGGPPELHLDLDRDKLRAPMAVNPMESPRPVSQETIVEPPIQMSHVTPGIPIPDQRSNVISSSQGVVQTDRDVRKEKIPTQVEQISRIPPIQLNNILIDQIPSGSQERILDPERWRSEMINPHTNLGHKSTEMALNAGEVRNCTQTIAMLNVPAQNPYTVSETIEVRSPEDLKRLYAILSQPANFSESASSTLQFTANEVSLNREPYYSSIDRVAGINQQGEQLHMDQAILPGQLHVSENTGMLFALDNPLSTSALLTSSERFNTDPIQSSLDNKPHIQPKALSLTQNSISLRVNGESHHQNWDDGGAEIEPMPIQPIPSLPKPPSLSRDHSSDQIESYDDSEYTTDHFDQFPQPLRTTASGTQSPISPAVAQSVSVEPDHTEPLDLFGHLRVKPAKTTDSMSSKVVVSNVLSTGQVQGPSTQFHSSRINQIAISTDSLSSRPQSSPLTPVSSIPTTSSTTNSETVMRTMMERIASYPGVGSSLSAPAVGEFLPGHTSQVRITKETVSRRVEWDWKRDFTGDTQNQTPGHEVGWATMNDSYEVQREIRLYTDGFVPPFALGEHPQILINLNGQPGLQYDMEFGDLGNIRVGVRTNSAATTTTGPAMTHNNTTTTTNNTMANIGPSQDNSETESTKSRPEKVQPKTKGRCLPIRQLFPKKTSSAMR